MAYDAAWALAIALNITAAKIMSNDVEGCEDEYGELLPLEEFQYSNDKMGCLMINSFFRVNFMGITVHSLDKTTNFGIFKSIIEMSLVIHRVK